MNLLYNNQEQGNKNILRKEDAYSLAFNGKKQSVQQLIDTECNNIIKTIKSKALVQNRTELLYRYPELAPVEFKDAVKKFLLDLGYTIPFEYKKEYIVISWEL